MTPKDRRVKYYGTHYLPSYFKLSCSDLRRHKQWQKTLEYLNQDLLSKKEPMFLQSICKPGIRARNQEAEVV